MTPPLAKNLTVPQLLKKTAMGEKLSMITAYDAAFARLFDAAGIDMILVGDSMGMVIQGHDNTLPVTLEDVLYHTQCVTRVVQQAHVTADMPFMSYQVCIEQGLENAGRLVKEAKAQSVKMEGGEEIADTVYACVKSGIPVIGHIGLKPQQIHNLGGYKIQGKNPDGVQQLLSDARILEEAGCFALVLEGIAMETAATITKSINIPTIGIASGPDCSGQVLVMHDLLGLQSDFRPRHAKAYADLSAVVTEAVQKYILEINTGQFPRQEHGVHRDLKVVQKR